MNSNKRLAENVIKSNLDSNRDIEIDGVINATYADAINSHRARRKKLAKELGTLEDTSKKAPFVGVKGKTSIMPENKDLRALHLCEELFEDYNDDPNTYDHYFRLLDNLEHVCSATMEMTDEEWTPKMARQTYEVLKDTIDELEDIVEQLEARDDSVNEAVKIDDPVRQKWGLEDKRNARDLWTAIYNELDSAIKGIEAKGRKFKGVKRYDYEDIGIEDDAITVGADSEEKLEFAKQVADAYGVTYRIDQPTSRYAKYPFIIKIFTKPLEEACKKAKSIKGPKSIKESAEDLRGYNIIKKDDFFRITDDNDVELDIDFESEEAAKEYIDTIDETDFNESKSINESAVPEVAKHFDYRISNKAFDVLSDLVERAESYMGEAHEIEDAVAEAIDDGLIYTNDIWEVKRLYESPEIEEDTYESLYSDLYSIVASRQGEDEE